MYLNCHSYFSIRYGIVSPKDLAQWAAQCSLGNGRIPICLTDINNVSGIPDFFREAGKHSNIHPCWGIDFREGGTGGRCLYIGIAKNEAGFAELNRFLSWHLIHKVPLPETAPEMEHAYIIYPFERTDAKGFKTRLGPNEYIGVRPEQLGKLRFSKWKSQKDKLLALQTATFRNGTDHNTHRLLRCIANNCLLSKLPLGEAAPPSHLFRETEELLDLYADAPLLVHNAMQLLESCEFRVTFGENQNKKIFTADAEEDFRLMTDLAMEGLRYRYPKYNYATKQRLESEMKLIYELGFTSYFLISWDICRFAREQGFYYVGRGSGANSMVAYCLRITDVDPIDLDLYFERFINPYRTSPPDFDLDFSWQDRDSVTDYIFKKHGTEHTALLATYSTFQANAVVRELGKVFGLPKEEIDHLLDKPTYFSPSMLEEATGNRVVGGNTNHGSPYAAPGIGERPQFSKHVRVEQRETLAGKIMRYAHRIHDTPNYRSIHAGGILISDKPIFHYSALDMPPKGFQTVQWSMLEAEDLGLAKFDILSQRGLGHIKDAIQIVKQNRGEDIDIHRIQEFKKDDRIRRLISTGHTTGCFYVESPAMRQLLRKLKCEDYLTLVAASSVIRPGVARSGMMRGYIERHIDPEKRKDAHPVLQEIMPDTYGIMVYQEDVIKVAHHFAGLGLAESDVLRRGMSGKFRSREEFQKVKDRFFELCKEKGHADTLAGEVWHQIESFAGYSFAKGHSASYAVESYQSLYLKAYYPIEFYVGVINNFGGFYRTEFYVHAARMCGADVQAPCVNHSKHLTSLQDKTIHLGLIHIASLEKKLAQRLVQEREQHGPFESLFDFTERVSPGLEQLKILIRIGAFRFTGKNRKELMWEAHWLSNKNAQTAGKASNKRPAQTPNTQNEDTPSNVYDIVDVKVQQELFREAPKTFQLPNLTYDTAEDAFEQMELLGFMLCNPFQMVARVATVVGGNATVVGDNTNHGYGDNTNHRYGDNTNHGYGDNTNHGYGDNTNYGYGDNTMHKEGDTNHKGDTNHMVDNNHHKYDGDVKHKTGQLEDTATPRRHTARSILRCVGKPVEIEGYLVTIKPTRTVKGQEMNFGTWLDRDGYFFDSTHFPDAVRKWPFKGRGVYLLRGIVSDDFGVVSVDVISMQKLPYVADPRYE